MPRSSPGEDPGRGSLPAPEPSQPPTAGPVVLVDSGIQGNWVIGGAFDSLLAKLIMWGESRSEALALGPPRLTNSSSMEWCELPFHRAVVRDRAFTTEPVIIFTQWIETEFKNEIPSFSGAAGKPAETRHERRLCSR